MIQNLNFYKQEAPNNLSSIIAGLNYLQGEAQKSKMPTVANLLKIAARDILFCAESSYNIDTTSDEYLKSLVIDPSVYAAFEFLAKFALLDDKKLKNDVIDTISTLTKTGGFDS